jgi:hypothetical protein
MEQSGAKSTISSHDLAVILFLIRQIERRRDANCLPAFPASTGIEPEFERRYLRRKISHAAPGGSFRLGHER